MPTVSFYFDVGSPYAYLAAERLQAVLPGPVEWRPVLLGGLFRATGRSSWALGDPRRREAGMAEVERRARSYGLPPLRWPDPWPSDYLAAMLAITFAFAHGRGHELARRSFREAFQNGSQLGQLECVLACGAAVGIDTVELEAATRDPEVKRSLRSVTDEALRRGVFGVPTVAVDEELFWGDDRLEDAAAHLRTVAA